MAWNITNHVCAACLGRVLSSDDGMTCRCSNCGLEKTRIKDLCCCGMRLKSNRDAGIRCVTNPNRTPEMPAEIIATEAP
jgi:hypothetical protein